MDVQHLLDRHYPGRYPGTRPPVNLLAKSVSFPASEGKRILIVDDDPYFRGLLKLMLAQTGLPVTEICEAEESRTALTLCREQTFDLVFCDLNLPCPWSSNGIEIVQQIRKIRQNLPVYMVTAENEEDLIEDVRSSGATGHILKPVSLRIVKRVLGATFLWRKTNSVDAGKQ